MTRTISRSVIFVAMLLSVLLVRDAWRVRGGSEFSTNSLIGKAFQYQLQTVSGRPGLSATGGIELYPCGSHLLKCNNPKVFDIDLYGPNGRTPNAKAVAAIHRVGGYAICYIDAGTWEDWRPDANVFPSYLLGLPNGWPGERWLNISDLGVLLPIMKKRVAECARAGFNAVEFDNVDGYTNDTGFTITAKEQIRYNEALARLAHIYGLAVGLKNDYGQIRTLESYFDFAVDEQCVQYHGCNLLEPFISAGKAVFDVEYEGRVLDNCRRLPKGISLTQKSLALLPLPYGVCA